MTLEYLQVNLPPNYERVYGKLYIIDKTGGETEDVHIMSVDSEDQAKALEKNEEVEEEDNDEEKDEDLKDNPNVSFSDYAEEYV